MQNPTPSLRRPSADRVFIGAAVVALVTIIALSFLTPAIVPAGNALDWWGGLAILTLLIAVSGDLALDISGADLTLTNLLAISGLLIFGPAPTLWSVVVGEAVSDVVRTLLAEPLRTPHRTAQRTVIVIATNIALQVFSLLAGWLILSALGGQVPLKDFSALPILPLGALFISYFIVNNLLFSLHLKIEQNEPIRKSFWYKFHIVVLFDLLPLPLSIFVADVCTNLGLLSFAGLSAFLLGGMVVIHILNGAQISTEQRVRELTSLAAISQALRSSLDLHELLEIIHQHIGQLMDANNFCIAMYDRGTDYISFPLVYENGQAIHQDGRSSSNGMAELIIRTQKPCLIRENVQETFRQLGVDLIGPPAESWLGVPILVEDRALGAIVVHHPTERRAYDESHLTVLTTVASQAALALSNAQLYSATRHRAVELAILSTVSTTLSASLDLKQVAKVIVDAIGPVIGCQKSAFFLLNDTRTYLELFEAKGLTEDYIQSARHLRVGPNERGMVAYTRTAILTPDIHTNPNMADFCALADAEGFRAVAEVPLIAQDQVMGTLVVYYAQPHQFIQAELDLLSTFANQAAVAVANARLYARTDQALARRVEELSAIEEIGHELIITLDAKRIIDRVLGKVMEVTGANHGVVILFNTALEEARLLAYRGYSPETMAALAEKPWPLDMGITGRVLRTRQSANIPNVRADPDYYQAMAQVKSQLSVPIVCEEQVLGVISLESDVSNAFDSHDLSFAEQLGNQAAIALTNARLYEEAQRRLREISILYEASQQLTSILDINLLTRKIAEQMCKALDSTSCLLEFLDQDVNMLEGVASYTAAIAKRPITETAYAAPAPTADYPATARSLQTREPLIVYADDPATDPDERRLLVESQQNALLSLALVAGDNVIGVVEWLDERPRRFSDDEVRLGQTLANQAAITVENARLFNERTRRINDLSQLYRASLALAGRLESQEVLTTIGTILRDITDSDTATLYLYDATTDTFQPGTTIGVNPLFGDIQAIRPNGLTRRVVTEQRPILIADTQLDPSINPRVLEAGFRSLICAPVISKGHVLGVLFVNSHQPHAYTEDDVQLVSALANQAAVSIESTRLFQRVAEGRNRLQAILNSASEGILMVDLSGRVIIVNPMLEALWQTPRQAIEGRLLEDLINRPSLKIADKLGLLLTTLDPFKQLQQKIRDTYQLPAPSLRFVERTTTPVLDADDKLVGWMLTLRDVTDERELQQMRDDLTSMIVHDLRSPLGAILSGLTMIRELVAGTSEADFAQEVVQISERSTRKLLTLVDSLLDISKGRLQLCLSAIDLQALVKNVLDTLAPLAAENGIILSAQLPPSLPLVDIDEDKINRVILNLVDNALKFTPVGHSVTVLAEVVGDKVRCAVRDAGPGIPAEYVERIFDRFVQVPNQAGRRRGTGLGLAFCKLAVEAHGERIWVESTEGKGSTFYFTLPIHSTEH